MSPDHIVLCNLSGRGDKDMHTAAEWFGLVDETSEGHDDTDGQGHDE